MAAPTVLIQLMGGDSSINNSLITLFLVKTKQNMSGSFHSRKLLIILGNKWVMKWHSSVCVLSL